MVSEKASHAHENLVRLGKTVTPTKIGNQNFLKNLDSVLRLNDERAPLQQALK
jgi:hypothetical protein